MPTEHIVVVEDKEVIPSDTHFEVSLAPQNFSDIFLFFLLMYFCCCFLPARPYPHDYFEWVTVPETTTTLNLHCIFFFSVFCCCFSFLSFLLSFVVLFSCVWFLYFVFSTRTDMVATGLPFFFKQLVCYTKNYSCYSEYWILLSLDFLVYLHLSFFFLFLFLFC